MIVNRRLQVEKTKRMMDIIVYSSSAIDIVIAILVTVSYLKLGDTKFILVPVEYMLTATVALTIVLGILLMYMKHYESMLAGFLHVGGHIKLHISKFQSLVKALSTIRPPKYRYRYRYRYKN